MTTQISGTTGVSKVQDGVVVQADLAANVAVNGPAFSAYTSASPLISGSSVKPNLTESYDTANAFTPTGAKFQPSVAGYYQFNLSFELNALMSNGYCALSVNNNAALIKGAQGNLYASVASGLVYMNGTTDYVEAVLYQSSGSTYNATVIFSGYLVRAA